MGGERKLSKRPQGMFLKSLLLISKQYYRRQFIIQIPVYVYVFTDTANGKILFQGCYVT